MNGKSKKAALFGLMIALAFVLSYLESLIPFHFGIPGIRLGLANSVVLTALYIMPKKDAFLISILRIILAGFTFNGVSAMLFSLAGGLLSFAVMAVLQKSKRFSVIGVSAAGGISHNAGQLAAAAIAAQTAGLLYYIPVLIISGAVTGVLTGTAAELVIKRMKKEK